MTDNHPAAVEPVRRPSRLLWWLQPKVALPLTVMLLVLLAPFLYRAQRIAQLPDVGHPFDVKSFGTVSLAPAENAMTRYSVAAKLQKVRSVGTDDVAKAVELLPGDWSALPTDIRDWLDDNQTAMAEWRAGTVLDQALVVQPNDLHINTVMEVLQFMRGFADLAWLQAERSRNEDDVATAWDWLRASVRASRHNGQNGVMIQRLVGFATFSNAALGIVRWSADQRVDQQLLRKALEEYQAAEALTSPDSVAWKCEYLMIVNSISDRITAEMLHETYRKIPKPLVKPAMFVLGDPEFSLRLSQMIFQVYLSTADRPKWDRPNRMSGADMLFDRLEGEQIKFSAAALMRHARSPCLAAEILAPYDNIQHIFRREAARRAALRLVLAAQLYRRIHGDWPSTLAALVPEILKEVPADPFGKSGEPLLLKRDGDDLLIYSVGRNESDDGGTFANGNVSLDEGYRLKAPTKSVP